VTSLAFHANEKDKTELADLDFISTAQLLIFNPYSIHVGPVETAHILQAPTLSSMSKLCMTSANGDIVEKNIALFRATDNYYFTAWRKSVLCPLARTTMHDQHGGTIG